MTSNISLEHIRSLESENASLESEGMQLENEKQKLQHKLKVLTELYQENEMKLHRWETCSVTPLGDTESGFTVCYMFRALNM